MPGGKDQPLAEEDKAQRGREGREEGQASPRHGSPGPAPGKASIAFYLLRLRLEELTPEGDRRPSSCPSQLEQPQGHGPGRRKALPGPRAEETEETAGVEERRSLIWVRCAPL